MVIERSWHRFSLGWLDSSHVEVLSFWLVTRDKPKGVGLGGYSFLSTNEGAAALKRMDVLSTFS